MLPNKDGAGRIIFICLASFFSMIVACVLLWGCP